MVKARNSRYQILVQGNPDGPLAHLIPHPSALAREPHSIRL